MRSIFLALVAVFVVAFQLVSAPACAIYGFAPSFPWIFVIFASVYASRAHAFLVAVCVGLALDAVSLDPWGSNVLSLVVLSHAIDRAGVSGWLERSVPTGVAISLSYSLAAAIRYGLLVLLGARVDTMSFLATCGITLLYVWPSLGFLRGFRRALLGRTLQESGRWYEDSEVAW